MLRRLTIGIDPGQAGGLAFIHAPAHGERFTEAIRMPATDADLLEAIRLRVPPTVLAHAFLERVGVMPRQGLVSAFTFGQGFGALKMALAAAGVPYDLVTPQTWQGALGCLTRGDKNISKRRAQQLFPRLTVTHHTADCLLIAEYGRRLRSGELHGKAKKATADRPPT